MRPILALLFLASISLPAQTEDRVRRSVPVPATGRLTLNAEMGAIRVQPGTASSVDVEVYFRGNAPSRAEFDRMLRDFSLEVTEQGGEVRVSGRFTAGWQSRFPLGGWGGRWCNNGRCLEYTWLREIEYRASVPPRFATDVRTSGGSITVGDLKGAVEARTSGGSLNFGRIDGPVNGRTSGGSITLLGGNGRATLHTSGGGIRIEEAAGEVDASTSGGSIEIRRTTGRVYAHTSGGGITVREASGPVDASTSGGSIDVTLAGGKGYDLDASTSGGGVSSDFPVQTSGERRPQRLQGPVNGGGPLVRLRTSGGGIRIRRAG